MVATIQPNLGKDIKPIHKLIREQFFFKIRDNLMQTTIRWVE